MNEREGRQLEYKEKLNSYNNLLKTVIAFSNDIGGKIVIGVADKTLATVGLSEDYLEKYLEEIPRAIFDAITSYSIPQSQSQ